jgi:hypothetical protein
MYNTINTISYNLPNTQNITPISVYNNYNNYYIDDSIQHVFPTSEFEFKINKIRDKHNNEYEKVKITDKVEKSCIDFTIKEDLIYVDWLNNCESGTGTTILQKVEQFAREIGIFKITLEDASQINTPCHNRVSLEILSILTTGKSWYNKLGYICENQDEIYKHYDSIIQMSFSDFIDHVYRIIEENYINHLHNFETLINILVRQKKIVFFFESTTVQQVFIKIKEMFKKGQPCLADIEPHLVLLIGYIKMSNILLLPPNRQIFTKILSLEDDGKGMHRKKQKRTKKQKRRTKRTKTNKFLRKKLR